MSIFAIRSAVSSLATVLSQPKSSLELRRVKLKFVPGRTSYRVSTWSDLARQ